MIHLLIIAISLLQINATHCWGSSGSNMDGDIKQPVNFSGKLITYQDQEYMIDNISIEGKYKNVIMYDKPIKHTEPAMNADTKQLEIKLEDPKNLVETKINFSEVSSVHVPSPNTVWVYQKKERQQRKEYIEVEISFNSNTKKSFLLEKNTHILCNEIDAAGPQEKRIPLVTLDKLIIEGYACRTESTKPASCPIVKNQ